MKGEVDVAAYSVRKTGETFGLFCLARPDQNNVTAIANKKTRVLSIDGEVSRKLMKQNSKMGLEIMARVIEISLHRLNTQQHPRRDR